MIRLLALGMLENEQSEKIYMKIHFSPSQFILRFLNVVNGVQHANLFLTKSNEQIGTKKRKVHCRCWMSGIKIVCFQFGGNIFHYDLSILKYLLINYAELVKLASSTILYSKWIFSSLSLIFLIHSNTLALKNICCNLVDYE